MSELRTNSDPSRGLGRDSAQDAGRERMLRELLVTLDEHQRGRRVRRAAKVVSAGVVVAAVVVAGAQWGLGKGDGRATPGQTVVTHTPEVPLMPVATPAFRCEIVATRDVASEVTVRARTTTMVQFIDDEQLLAALNRERPCYGLVRTGGRVAVLDRCVR